MYSPSSSADPLLAGSPQPTNNKRETRACTYTSISTAAKEYYIRWLKYHGYNPDEMTSEKRFKLGWHLHKQLHDEHLRKNPPQMPDETALQNGFKTLKKCEQDLKSFFGEEDVQEIIRLSGQQSRTLAESLVLAEKLGQFHTHRYKSKSDNKAMENRTIFKAAWMAFAVERTWKHAHRGDDILLKEYEEYRQTYGEYADVLICLKSKPMKTFKEHIFENELHHIARSSGNRSKDWEQQCELNIKWGQDLRKMLQPYLEKEETLPGPINIAVECEQKENHYLRQLVLHLIAAYFYQQYHRAKQPILQTKHVLERIANPERFAQSILDLDELRQTFAALSREFKREPTPDQMNSFLEGFKKLMEAYLQHEEEFSVLFDFNDLNGLPEFVSEDINE